jgi:hypothetical protein
VVLGLELRAFTLSHSTSPFFLWRVFSRQGLTNYLPRLALNHDPPDLCLLSSQDYRREPLAHGSKDFFCPHHLDHITFTRLCVCLPTKILAPKSRKCIPFIFLWNPKVDKTDAVKYRLKTPSIYWLISQKVSITSVYRVEVRQAPTKLFFQLYRLCIQKTPIRLRIPRVFCHMERKTGSRDKDILHLEEMTRLFSLPVVQGKNWRCH